MEKQIVHDWSTGELVEYEIEAEETVITELPAEENTTE